MQGCTCIGLSEVASNKNCVKGLWRVHSEEREGNNRFVPSHRERKTPFSDNKRFEFSTDSMLISGTVAFTLYMKSGGEKLVTSRN